MDTRVYCSAGINYAVVCPNGDVYRCMADYGDGRAPLFNVKDGWQKGEKSSLCSHPKCEASCDMRYTTKGVFSSKNEGPKMVQCSNGDGEDFSYLHFPDQPVDEVFRRNVHIVWMPTLRCNYTCYYCETAAGRHKIQDIRSAYPELPIEEWFDAWRKIHEMYEFMGVSISGGEPLLSEATLPIIELLGDNCDVDVTTNLSVNVMSLVRSVSKVCLITASLHPTSKGFNKELFFGALLYLKNNGHNVCVNFVGYPLQLFLAEEYEKWCDEHGITFNVDYWSGGDHSGFFPKLSEAEQGFMNKIATPRQVEFQLFRHKIKTKLQRYDIEQGDSFGIKGTIKNVGTCAWRNKGLSESEAFRLGVKIMRFGNERDVLREVRVLLPSHDILPGDSCDFKIAIDNCGLPPEIYLMKIDILKDGPEGFWFEHRGADYKKLKLNVLKGPRYRMVLEKKGFEMEEGDILSLKGKIQNTGEHPWLSRGLPEREGCKIGVQIASEENADEVFIDFRSLTFTEDVAPGDWYDFEIKGNTRDFKSGSYSLKIDMLREGLWWFEERGAHCKEAKLNILKGPRYRMVLEKADPEIEEGDILSLKGKIQNTGDRPWLSRGLPEKEAYKIGVRVSSEEKLDEVLMDFRSLPFTEDVAPGDWYDFEIKGNTRGLGGRVYYLKIDVLREGSLWFEQRGAHCKKAKLNILKGPRYRMVLEKADPEIEEGDILSLKGKIQNTGDRPWLSKGLPEKEAYKIGVRVATEEKPNEVLMDFRSLVFTEDVAPGDWYDFEIKGNTRGLGGRVYYLKIDVLREGSFWFEQRGAHSKKAKLNILKGPRYTMVLEKADPEIEEGDILSLKGKIQNTGDRPWLSRGLPEEEAYKIGVRVTSEENPDDVLMDFRSLTFTEDVSPGDWYGFEIKWNTRGFKRGSYCLKIDMLREGLWWFEERGAQPPNVKVRVV